MKGKLGEELAESLEPFGLIFVARSVSPALRLLTTARCASSGLT